MLMADPDDEIPPTPERLTKGDVIEPARGQARAGDKPPLRVATQTMLDRYVVRGHISEQQYQAGLRLYATWRKTGRALRMTSSYERTIPSTGEMSPQQRDAWTEVNEAMRAVGKQLSAVLVHVVFCDEPARTWATANGGDAKGGILVLRMALNALADHYRLRRACSGPHNGV